jgi:hypothetical protein
MGDIRRFLPQLTRGAPSLAFLLVVAVATAGISSPSSIRGVLLPYLAAGDPGLRFPHLVLVPRHPVRVGLLHRFTIHL